MHVFNGFLEIVNVELHIEKDKMFERVSNNQKILYTDAVVHDDDTTIWGSD